MDPQLCQELIAGLRQIVDEYRAECLRERNWRIASLAMRQSVELPNRGNGNLNLEKEESSSVETKCCAKPKKCDPQIWSKDNIRRALKMRGLTTMEKRRAKKRGRVANKVQFQREINFDLKVQEKIQETVIVARINQGRTLFDQNRNNGGKRFVKEKRRTQVTSDVAKPSGISNFTFDPGGVSKDTVYALSDFIAIFHHQLASDLPYGAARHRYFAFDRGKPPLVTDRIQSYSHPSSTGLIEKSVDLMFANPIFVFDPGGNYAVDFTVLRHLLHVAMEEEDELVSADLISPKLIEDPIRISDPGGSLAVNNYAAVMFALCCGVCILL